MKVIALVAYALEPFVWDGWAWPAAWGALIGGAALLAGFVYLIINGG